MKIRRFLFEKGFHCYEIEDVDDLIGSLPEKLCFRITNGMQRFYIYFKADDANAVDQLADDLKHAAKFLTKLKENKND